MLVYRSNKPFAGKLREFKGKVWSCGWNVCVVMCKPPSKKKVLGHIVGSVCMGFLSSKKNH